MSNISENTFLSSATPSSLMIKILWRQQQELQKKSPDGVTPIINNEDPLDIQANIEGPKDTPYEGGIFHVKIVIPPEFPHTAPKGYFVTKIFHPNVSEKGEICVNTLKRDWNPKSWSLYNLFEVIKCLLIVPFPESSLNEEAGKIFMENYNDYFKIAKIFTNVHAHPHSTKIVVKEEQQAISPQVQVNPTILLQQVTPQEKEDTISDSKYNFGNDYSLIRSKTVHAKPSVNIFTLLNRATSRENFTCSTNSPVKCPFSPVVDSMKCDLTITKMNTENLLQEKPVLSSLPFIRSNSVYSNQSSVTDENRQSNGFFSSNLTGENECRIFSHRNSISSGFPCPTPKSKKEEIKKWLSRI